MRTLKELAEKHLRWGMKKMAAYVRNQGKQWNHKRIARIYREEELHLRVKSRKRLSVRAPVKLEQPTEPNHTWSIDFMSDSLVSGRRFRTLNILDDYNREALWIEVGTSLPSGHVTRVLDAVITWHGKLEQIRVDNGPEFISKEFMNWAEKRQIRLLYIQPGKPAQNGYIERFNRTYRESVLDAYLFQNLGEVREITEQWLKEYNTLRPHDSLRGLTPCQFAAQRA